jgi:hypothetical protein
MCDGIDLQGTERLSSLVCARCNRATGKDGQRLVLLGIWLHRSGLQITLYGED